jgi:hypothetical protein
MTSPSVKLLRTQSDDRLVALAAAGHERAFEAIVERWGAGGLTAAPFAPVPPFVLHSIASG